MTDVHRDPTEDSSGCVAEPVRTILRLEHAIVLAVLVYLYWQHGASWILFAVFLLAPDLLMAGYLRNTRLGAILYNTSHSYIGPLLLGAFSLYRPELVPAAIIWAAHIAFDRALGYGLKYADSFQHTHLGMIGRAHRGTRN